MQPAADEMAQALAAAAIVGPRAAVVANVTARPTNDPEAIGQRSFGSTTPSPSESVDWAKP